MLKTTKKLGETKEIIKAEKEEVENEIECLELSGRKRKRIIEENLVDLVDIDRVEYEIKELGIGNIEENPMKLDINEVEEEVIEENTFEEETNSENIKSNNGNNKSKGNKNIRNIDNKNNIRRNY